METEIKIFGALALAISAGALLGMSTPTSMKEAPEPSWRIAAREINAGQAMQLAKAPVIYSSMPEELSTDIGYGSPGAYQAFYVDAPVRTAYTQVPNYAPKALGERPEVRIAADAAALAARDARDHETVAPEPVKVAAVKTVEFAAAETNPDYAPVFDNSGDAPAMDAGGEDE